MSLPVRNSLWALRTLMIQDPDTNCLQQESPQQYIILTQSVPPTKMKNSIKQCISQMKK